jgi:predicted XRE-type DNA-binding protein
MKKFPSRKEIESVLKEIEVDPGSSVLPPNASAKERLKFQLCEAIVIYFRRKRLTQRQLAEQLEVDEAKVSKVLHYKVEEFSIDRLINYAETLGIKYEFKLVA